MRKVAVKRDKREFNVHVKSTMDFEVKTKRDRDDQREPQPPTNHPVGDRAVRCQKKGNLI